MIKYHDAVEREHCKLCFNNEILLSQRCVAQENKSTAKLPTHFSSVRRMKNRPRLSFDYSITSCLEKITTSVSFTSSNSVAMTADKGSSETSVQQVVRGSCLNVANSLQGGWAREVCLEPEDTEALSWRTGASLWLVVSQVHYGLTSCHPWFLKTVT